MNRFILQLRFPLCLLLGLTLLACQGTQIKGAEENQILGPQSKLARGELHVLVAAVRFPDVEPRFSLDRIRKRAVKELDDYLREQSYGRAWLKADFRGWLPLPDPLSRYKVSPYNHQVDRTRVRKLIEDTMTTLENQVDFSK